MPHSPAAQDRLLRAALASVISFLVLAVVAETAAGATWTFTPTADAYVHSGRPKTNFGKATMLKADASPNLMSFLRFNITGLTGSVTKATLRVRAMNTSSLGFSVRSVASNTWGEMTVTYANAPARGSMMASGIKMTKSSWASAGVTSFVPDNGAVSFAITASTTTELRLSSREAGSTLAPQLVIETSTAPPPPPPPPPPAPTSGVDPAANCIGEPANHPVVSYPEPRVFLEAQGWWDDRDDDGQVARFGDSEHLHIGMCFPLQQAVSGTVRLDIRVVGHNLPAGSLIRNTRFHDAPGQLYEDIRYERTVISGEMDATVWKTLNWDSSEAPDGLRETRFLTFVERPDGAEIHASTGWCVNFQNGKTDSNYDSCGRRLTEGRGWYDCFEYKSSRIDEWTYPYEGITSGQAYTLNVSGQDGATFGDGGDDVVTSHWLRLDPNFHSSDLGTSIFAHGGAHRNEAVTVPGSLLTPGVHFLFLMTERDGRCTQPGSGTVFPGQLFPQDGIVSGGLRIPIKVN